MMQTSTQFYAKRRPISKSSIFGKEKAEVYLEAVSLSEKLTLPLNGGNEKNVFGILLAAHSFMTLLKDSWK